MIPRPTEQFGASGFGIDYTTGFKPWITAHYPTVVTFGDPPLRAGSRFAIAVLERTVQGDTVQAGTPAPMGG